MFGIDVMGTGSGGMLAYASGGYLLSQMVDVRLRERGMSAAADAGCLPT